MTLKLIFLPPTEQSLSELELDILSDSLFRYLFLTVSFLISMS